MSPKTLTALLLLLLCPIVLFAQSGKIAGKVTDLENREPLIGATVKVVGTTLGASTDLNGNFVILNVPIGTHTLECNYIGYKKVTHNNVRVISNQTTDRNFQLPNEAYKIETAVDIVAQRPLINKNEMNQQLVKNQDEIQNLPVRGVEAIVALSANVIDQGGLHIGGSRADQVRYVSDGVNITNPVSGGRAGSMINNAIEEISVQAGGYSAEYGGANGGIIMTTTRSGGRTLQFSGEFFTDSWTRPGTEVLGTRSYGISQYVLTAGGPIAGPLRFFIAGQQNFQRTGAGYFNGYSMNKFYDRMLATPQWKNIYNENKYSVALDQRRPAREDKPLFIMENGQRVPLTVQDQNSSLYGKQLYGIPGADGLAVPIRGIFDPNLGAGAKVVPIEYPKYTINGASQGYTFQGSLTADLNQINLRFSGTYGYGYSRGGAGVTTINAENRAGVSESENINTALKFTHMLTNNTFYELSVGYYKSFGVSYDPELQQNVALYGDSVENAKYGYYLRGDGLVPLTRNVFGSNFVDYGYPLAGYGKSGFEQVSGKLGFVHQIGRVHEIKFGGEVQTYTVRNYDPGSEFGIKSFWRSNPTASVLDFMKNSGMNNYGYDAWGNKVDDANNVDGPKRPLFAGVYLLDKIELEDLVLNIGLRYDLIDTDSKVFKDPNNINYNEDGTIDESNFEEAGVSQTISPRIGFSFPVTDQTQFYAQYGKFVAQSRLRDVYMGRSLMAFQIQGGYAIGNPVGFGLRPERTTQYDIGFRQQIGENFSLDIGARYADVRGQVQMRQIPAAPGAEHQAYYAWVNGDFQTTVSTSLRLTLRRVERIQASVDYTYSDARGTGSTPSTSFRTIWQAPTGVPYFPEYTTAVDWDQTHRGSVNFDYRFDRDDGPSIGGIYPLERVGLNMLFTFNSGHPYTRVDPRTIGQNSDIPIEELNASRTPWVFQIDARIDKSFKLGPLDMNAYLWIINLLDTKNVTSVYQYTGSATDNGYLASENGQKQIANYASYGDVFSEAYVDWYRQQLGNAGVYGGPRQIRLGLRFFF